MNHIFKSKKSVSRNGSGLFEFALAASLLSVAYFSLIIPTTYNQTQRAVVFRTASNTVAIYNDAQRILPINAIQHDPMTITSKEQEQFIKRQITQGFDAIPPQELTAIVSTYFKSGFNKFHGKVTATAARQCLHVQTAIPQTECIWYSINLLNKPEVFGVKINDNPTVILKGSNHIVHKIKMACLGNKSQQINVTAMFCNSI